MRGGGACCDLRGDGGAGAEAGIDEAAAPKPVQRLPVKIQPLGLEDYLPVPLDSEPAEILDDRIDMIGAGSARVDILDPKQEGASSAAREIVGEQGRESVAQMQLPGRARRESGDELHRPS